MMNPQEIICFCSQVTKGQIVDALAAGAKTLGDIGAATGACTLGRCKELSPTGKCCSPVILKVIAEYEKGLSIPTGGCKWG